MQRHIAKASWRGLVWPFYCIALAAGTLAGVPSQSAPPPVAVAAIPMQNILAGAVVDPSDTTKAIDALAPGPPRPTQDDAIELRRPQGERLIYPVPAATANQVAPPTAADPRESQAVPDRWRVVEELQVIGDEPLNPYHQNTLKGDRPFEPLSGLGPDWFFNLSVTSDTTFNASRIPIAVSPAGAATSGEHDVFGRPNLTAFNQTVLVSASITEGDTTFRPPDYELRFVPALNYYRATAQEEGVVNVNPADGLSRDDRFVGIQQFFIDKRLRDVSDNFDFDSIRFGIQPFTSDFRGFLFQDDAFGLRLFGTRDNNLWQYNLAWLRRVEKDTNSGLNDVAAGLRRDDTFVANLYRQDFPVEGHTTQFTVLRNINHEDNEPFYDANGFLERPAPIGDGLPHRYDVTYYGLNGDGHFGTWNLTSSLYSVFGHDSHNPIAQRSQQIQAGFAALELSRDFDWIRVRGTALVASGDKNPYDGRATGFDAIMENPDIVGADTSFFIHEAIPFIGGGGVSLTGQNSLLPNLRTSEDQGQSNFVNPGLSLLGIGADFDVSPQLRILTNLSDLSFVNTSSLEVLRNQANIDRDIGVDASVGLQYRPYFNQNVVLNASVAVLAPGKGFKQIYDTQRLPLPYSILVNLLLRY
ncbi:MAG: hypothetical protein ABSF50_09360 [Burkholderiaceae bacterium]